MHPNKGILHIYLSSPKREGAYIVGDEEGLFDLWLAIGETIISGKGQGSADVQTGQGAQYPIHILMVDRESHFLKEFIPVH